MSMQKREYIPECEYIEEDEIDLRELWETIKEGKKVIFLTVIVTMTLTFIYLFSLPNSYKSEAVLIPKKDESSMASKLGGLGGLAAMAGVNLGSGSMTPDVAFQSLLNDYGFMKNFIEKNHIYEYYTRDNYDENYVFALGFRGLYDLFHSEDNEKARDEEIYNLIKRLQKNFSVSADKKSALITIQYTDYNREYAAKMVTMFLEDASHYLIENSLDNINKRLDYFQKEMNQVEAFELRQSLSQMISQILQEKVMMKSKQYYQCDVLTEPRVAYVKDNVKPARGIILVVAFIISLILGVLVVFFRSFFKDENKKSNLI